MNVNEKDIKQLLRQYNDGTLVAKDEIYDQAFGYQHIQSELSDTWLIKHNLDSISFTDNVFVNGTLVFPDVTIIDSNHVQLKFSQKVSGIANFLFLDKRDIISNIPIVISEQDCPIVTPEVQEFIYTSGSYNYYSGDNLAFQSFTRADMHTSNVDESYILPEGYVFNEYTLLLRAHDNKIYVIVGDYYDGTLNKVIRLNQDGSLDASYSPVALPVESPASYIMQTSDGHIYIYAYAVNDDSIIKLNSDGVRDNDFVSPMFVYTTGSAKIVLEEDSSGRIYCGGDFTTVNGNEYQKLCRILPDGSLDTSFVNIWDFGDNIETGTFYINDVTTIDSNTYLAVEFRYDTPDPTNLGHGGIVRLNFDGTVDTTFTNIKTIEDVEFYCSKILQTVDGKIYISRYTYDGTKGAELIRLNSDGTLDTDYFDIEISGSGFTVWDMIQDRYGNIWIVGNFAASGQYENHSYMVTLDSTGSVIKAFKAYYDPSGESGQISHIIE